MDRREPDNALPAPSSLRSTTGIILLIIAAQIAISLITYPFLPAMVPSHWNIHGQVDSYLPKAANAILFPALSIFIYLLTRFLLSVASPRLAGEGKQATINTVNLLFVGILLFLLIVQMVTVAIALGIAIDITFVMSLALSALFVFIGNYLGKLRRNSWAGIRTPWTMSSDRIWERTHRLGSWLFVIAGLVGLLTSFIPLLRFWGVIVSILLASIIAAAYSYMLYNREHGAQM
jgi:uncharacterized membrane protein